jgi:hypothetical protein
MLIGLTTGLRFRLAVAFAAFAAFCFVAPPAVLAFGHGSNTLDCVAHADKVNHGRAAAHDAVHRDANAAHRGANAAHRRANAVHGEHAPAGDHSVPAGDHQMTCCGLFCLSALAADCGVAEPGATVAILNPAQAPNLFSRVAERLDRPPISRFFV